MIQFDPAAHRFSLNGQEVPSVTRILKAGGWIDEQWFTEEARKRGELVHKATALFDQQALDFGTIPDEIVAYVLQWEKACKELKLGIRRIEHIVHKGKLWAGIEDREVSWERQLTVVDIKTGAPKLADKLQGAGYAETHAKRARILLVYLQPDRYKAVELEKREREEVTFHWYQIQDLYHWRLRRNGK